MSDPGTASGSPADEDRPPTAASDDSKARFREALERKKAATHRTAAGAAGSGGVHGPEIMGSNRRVFRRKSG